MATQAIEQVPEPAADDVPATSSSGSRLTLILGVAGIAAGVAVGLFGVGPVLAKRKAHPAPAAAAAPSDPASAVTHAIENVVLNPAGSGGTRFLMVTAAFELKDAKAEQLMKDHEPEVRDRLLALLGKKTVEELAEIGQREKIKREVLDVVKPMFPPGSVLKVFFPQFVIQ